MINIKTIKKDFDDIYLNADFKILIEKQKEFIKFLDSLDKERNKLKELN